MRTQQTPPVSQEGSHEWISNTTKATLTVALLAIASLGLASILPGSTVGWLIVGSLGGGLCILNYTQERKLFSVLSTTALGVGLIVLGTLAGIGYISAMLISGILIGAFALVALYGGYRVVKYCQS